MLRRPKLSLVVEACSAFPPGTNVTVSVSHDSLLVSNDGGVVGPAVTFSLNGRKSIRKALDKLEASLNTPKKRFTKDNDNEEA